MTLALFTGGQSADPGFQQPLLPQLQAALADCGAGSRIALCVSFIRQSGLKLLRPDLTAALARGAQLRVITSDYLNVTEPVALRDLLKFPKEQSQILIYQSQGAAGFHLKSYLFIQPAEADGPLGCGFVGSSNISCDALTRSLEWNWCLKVTPQSSPQARHSLRELQAQVDALARDPRVIPLTHHWVDEYIERYQQAALAPVRAITGAQEQEDPSEIPLPNAVQQEALAALKAARQRECQRGLVVMATGLGKTWLAAFDVRQMQAARLLFVAHREEILLQAQRSFTILAPRQSSGLYTGTTQQQADWLFASIQTLGQSHQLEKFAPDYFDYIVVDEFHHAASPTYRRLLAHFKPRFLLGLTATPERTDQADILALCDNNLLFERHLAEAIDLKLLAPLIYHGLFDHTLDYQALPWRNGQFDPKALETAFASKKRAQHALAQWQRLHQRRTLAFCISTRHADYMADFFNQAGIPALAVYAGSQTDRHQALEQLDAGDIQVLFSVDLFNEGTDLPAIDTLLMLRPTESKIVFLQQLGRGLRRHPGKQHLVVIDLVGNHKACLYKPYLLRQQLRRTGGQGVSEPTALATGCHINLDPQLLPLLDQLTRGQRLKVVDEYQRLREELGYRPTALQAYEAGLDFQKLRQQHQSWFELVREQGDLTPAQQAVQEQCGDFLRQGVETTALTKCFKMILLQALLELDGLRQPPSVTALSIRSREVLSRYPRLAQQDLPDSLRHLSTDHPRWLRYWRDNPITFSTGGKAGSQSSYWFRIQNERFVPVFDLPSEALATLHELIQELVDLRLAEYCRRTTRRQAATEGPMPSQQTVIQLPFYPNLKIACGHFKQGDDSQMQWLSHPDLPATADPARHFLARASGHSMEGGKQSIADGALLLLERITPTQAGSITGSILAIELEDDAGQPQYLLRVVRKIGPGEYRLKANNPDYPEIPATEQMRPFARLKAVLTMPASADEGDA